MNLKKVATAPARGAKALNRMLFRRYPWRMWRFGASRVDYAALVGDGTGSSTVMAVVQWIARTFPEAPIALWRIQGDGQEERDAKHDLLRLLKWPNPYYTGATLWQATLTDWLTSGEAYWIKIRDRAGRPIELWFTPSATISPKGSESAFISSYVYRPGDGQEVILDPGDVVHFRYGLDPDDPKHGLSPLASVVREVYTDDEAATFTAALLRNSGVPGLLVSPKGDTYPSEDDVNATKSYVTESFSGERRGEPLVFSGPTEVQQFGFNPQQLALKDLRRIPEERVSAVFGVPAIVCGLGAGLDRSTFANFAEAREAAYESNIIPAQRLLSEQIQLQLLTDFEQELEDWRVGFDLSAVRVLQEDENAKAVRWDTMVKGGWARVAEARRALDLEVDDSDEIYLRPNTVYETTGEELQPTPAERADRAATALAAAQAERRQQQDGQAPDGNAPPDPNVRDVPKSLKLAGDQTPRMVELMKGFETDQARYATLLEDELVADFTALGQTAADAYLDLAGPDVRIGTNGKLLPALESLASRVAYALNLDSWRERQLNRRLAQHYRRVGEATARTIREKLGVPVTLTESDLENLAVHGANRRLLMDIRGQTRKALLAALKAGTEEGLSRDEIAALIRRTVPAGSFASSVDRAAGIARNETLVAQRAASIVTYRASPDIGSVVAFDGTGDPVCAGRNGRTFTLDEAEQQDEHPNGKLQFAPVVRDTVAV
jgi:HK97 family phage portal protein